MLREIMTDGTKNISIIEKNVCSHPKYRNKSNIPYNIKIKIYTYKTELSIVLKEAKI